MKLTVKEVVIFGMLGALMYVSKLVMDFLPNIHLIGVLITAVTIVYRKKALYPIYIFVFLTGFLGGFANWWIPYLYVWAVLWGMVMLIPKKWGDYLASPVRSRREKDRESNEGRAFSSKLRKLLPLLYMCVCAAHGFLYGVLYAPSQALLFGLSWEGMIAWIVAGLPFDITHGISNFCCGVLILPIAAALRTAERISE